MTRLENEKFKRYCHEKGFRGDHTTGETDAVEYDIFMWYIIIRRDLILPAKSCEKVARFLERTFRYYILFTYLLFWSLVCEKGRMSFNLFFLLQNCEIGKFGFILWNLSLFFRIRFQRVKKGGLMSESFSLWVKSRKKNVSNHYPLGG